jgi:hypothetical protein
MTDIPNEKTRVLKWTESQVELAALILQQGFAVLSIDEDTTKIFQQAAKSALAFILEEEEESSDHSDADGNVYVEHTNKNKYAYQRLSTNGHLMGYNEPSPAKQLFRAFFDKESEPQPWPNSSLQSASELAAKALHNILTECHSEIRQRLLRQSISNPASNIEDKRSSPELLVHWISFIITGKGSRVS